jgi:hypothetical protein
MRFGLQNKKEQVMLRMTKIALATVFVAGSATAALALPGPYYPGDHMLDYDPVNQAYEWNVNHDSTPGSALASARSGYAAVTRDAYRAHAQAAPRRVRHRTVVQQPEEPGYAMQPAYTPSPYSGPYYGTPNPWDKARQDDASEGGNGG